MNKEKEIKLKKILQYHRDRGIITKKKYKKELQFIKMLKQTSNENKNGNS